MLCLHTVICLNFSIINATCGTFVHKILFKWMHKGIAIVNLLFKICVAIQLCHIPAVLFVY